jgi:CelD/BcsL family acetyltransferase involved in cellulose biosynthesis
MKLPPSGKYAKVQEIKLRDGTASAWISREMDDAPWDKFLQQSPLGQFQQSAIWARVKEVEGWKPVRVVVTIDEEMVGGFQLLWRSSRPGRMGYVAKGPVVAPAHPGLADFATGLLTRLARSEKLRALIVQPPDLCGQMAAELATGGFDLETLEGVNDATWVVGLGDGFEAVERRMNGETRRKARRAAERGITIREGGRDDIQTFFDLMLSTCRRQEVSPSPPDVRSFFALWDAARLSGAARLTFAEWEGKPLAGQIDICFGQTVTQWKKGWSSSEAKRFPNDLLTHQALQWATANGFQFFDFAAFDRSMAIRMLNGEPLTPEQEKSRYIFLARMGGTPRLLPEAQIYLPNSVIRMAYRTLFRNKIRKAKAKSRTLGQLSGSSERNPPPAN